MADLRMHPAMRLRIDNALRMPAQSYIDQSYIDQSYLE
jgi:hypothetical protein